MSKLSTNSDSEDNITFGFLTYLSRSGSTFLSNLLNEYQDVCVTVEAGFPPEMLGVGGASPITLNSVQKLDGYLEILKRESRIDYWGIEISRVRSRVINKLPINSTNLFREFLYTYKNKHKPNAKVILYKGVPFLPWMLPDIKTHFPEAYIIHLLRDPRAVYNSQKGLPLPYSNQNFAYNAIQTVNEWQKAVNEFVAFDSSLVEIKYENLVLRKENTVNNLLHFLGVDNTKSLNNTFSEKIPSKEEELHPNIKKGPQKKYIDKWKDELPLKEIQIIQYGLKDNLRQKGYEIEKESNKKINFYFMYLTAYGQYHMHRFYYKLSRVLKGFVHNPKTYFLKLKSRLKR